MFHRFKGKGCSQHFNATVKEYAENTKAFIETTFSREIEAVEVDSIYVTYINQITGPRLKEWNPRPSIFLRDG